MKGLLVDVVYDFGKGLHDIAAKGHAAINERMRVRHESGRASEAWYWLAVLTVSPAVEVGLMLCCLSFSIEDGSLDPLREQYAKLLKRIEARRERLKRLGY